MSRRRRLVRLAAWTLASVAIGLLAGWYLGAASPTKLDFKTEKGITIGSTVAALRAAYGTDLNVARGEQGPGYNITLSKGIILGQLDDLEDTGKVKNIQAGNFCGE